MSVLSPGSTAPPGSTLQTQATQASELRHLPGITSHTSVADAESFMLTAVCVPAAGEGAHVWGASRQEHVAVGVKRCRYSSQADALLGGRISHSGMIRRAWRPQLRPPAAATQGTSAAGTGGTGRATLSARLREPRALGCGFDGLIHVGGRRQHDGGCPARHHGVFHHVYDDGSGAAHAEVGRAFGRQSGTDGSEEAAAVQGLGAAGNEDAGFLGGRWLLPDGEPHPTRGCVVRPRARQRRDETERQRGLGWIRPRCCRLTQPCSQPRPRCWQKAVTM